MKPERYKISEFGRHVAAYFSETTVHGFRYVAEGENVFEKTFWIISISVGFYVSGFYIFESFSDWERTPLQTTIDKVSMPIQDLYEPAITVCNPSELQMPRRNRWMFIEKLLNWIDKDAGRFYFFLKLFLPLVG